MVVFAVELAVALGVGLALHEHAHALAADRLGDMSPRRFGWLSLDPRPKIDPFGTVVLPLLILLPWAAGVIFLPPFAYAKSMPFDPLSLRDRSRGPVWVWLAGPLANLGLAAVGGLALRSGLTGEAARAALALLYANAVLFVFNLLPVPGLDGAKLLVRVLPPRAAHAFASAEHFLSLFMLVLYFVLAGPLVGIVNGLSNVACEALAGITCIPS